VSAKFPPIDPEQVRRLHADLIEADDGGASSNDWTQIVDDWFTQNGWPTILYRVRKGGRR
jgi:hypothetical protein